jgi:hypothetical protein
MKAKHFLIILIIIICLYFFVIKTKLVSIDEKKLSQSFPRKIHQTFKIKHLPKHDLFCKTRLKNMNNNKKWDFYLYDHDDMDFIIKSYFDSNIYQAYTKIEPTNGSILSDFFRICILYLYGGIYMDFKCCIYNLDLLLSYLQSIDNTDVMIVGNWDSPIWTDIFPENGEIRSSLIISTPKHPLLYECIQLMVNNINNYNDMDYKNNKIFKVLNLCGPHMLTRFVLEKDNDPRIIINNDLIQKIYKFQCFDYKSYYHKKNITHWHSKSDLPLIRKNPSDLIPCKKNMVIVTNILHINEKEKSIYSVDERFQQLLTTLKSIYSKIPNPYVVILEGSYFIKYQYNELRKQFPVYIVTHDITHLSKQYGELALIKNFLNVFMDIHSFQQNFDTFHKISGRYYLNDKFICMNSFAYKLHYISGRGRIETRYYRFPSRYIHDFFEKMNSIDVINTDIEFTFYSHKIFPIDYYQGDKLYIEGIIAPTGEFISE